jgi:acetyl esterase
MISKMENVFYSRQTIRNGMFEICQQRWLVITVMCLTLLSSSCDDDDNTTSDPERPTPEWAPTMNDQMRKVIEKFQDYSPVPITQLTVEQARNAPTLMDAAKDVAAESGIDYPDYDLDISHRTIEGPDAEGLLVRIYKPSANDIKYPVIVYLHGGGWVLANLDVYDASARALAQKVNAIVISVAYRKAPEHKFPAAHNDAYAAYKWARLNAGILNGDTARVAVAGESAGGNMAGAICLMARNAGFPQPTHQVLIYPVTNVESNTASYQQYANAKPLNAAMMSWFFNHYLVRPVQDDDPLISLMQADVSKLAPATIVTAEIDPLMEDGRQYADKLQKAGVDVSYQNYTGVTHEFFGLHPVLDAAKEAQDFVAGRLRQSFGQN